MDDVLRVCERVWRRLGVPAPLSAEMAAELRADLAAATADGVTAMAFVGGDPAGFARAWASARGVDHGRHRFVRVAGATVVGAVPGALAGLFVAYGLSSTAFAQLFQRGASHASSANLGAATHAAANTVAVSAGEVADPYLTIPGWLLLLLYVASGVLAYVGAVAAVSAALRSVGDPQRQITIKRLRLALPLGGAAGVVAAVVYAGTTAYSTSWPHPGVEAALAVVCVVATALIARRGPSLDEPTTTNEFAA